MTEIVKNMSGTQMEKLIKLLYIKLTALVNISESPFSGGKLFTSSKNTPKVLALN